MKVLTLIKAKCNVSPWYVQCCSCTRRSKTKILTTRAPPSWIEFDVVTSHRQTQHLEYGLWLLVSMFLRLLISCKRKIVCESQVIDSSRQYFWFSIFACSYSIARIKKKTLLFALIKVSTFICKREISGFSSPLNKIIFSYISLCLRHYDWAA